MMKPELPGNFCKKIPEIADLILSFFIFEERHR